MRADYEGALPVPPAPVEKSRGASLGACHHPAWKAFLKGSLSFQGWSFPGFLRPCPPKVAWPWAVLLFQSSRLSADFRSGLLE